DLNEQDKADLIHNLSGDLNKVNDAEVKAIMVSYFYRADKEYGTRLAKATDVNLKQVTKLASM
ncbi:catalase, partial [Vibrio vulnificus]